MAFTPPPISSENIAMIGDFPLRNTLITTWVVMIILIAGALIYHRQSSRLIPRGFQNLVETVIEGMYNFFYTVTGDHKQTKKFFALVATIFIFVFTANIFGLFPGNGTIGICEVHEGGGHAVTEESVEAPLVDEHAVVAKPASSGPCEEGKVIFPFLRSVNSDVNMTLALALISVTAVQFFGIQFLGFKHYAGKFFVNPFRDPIGSFVGILEIISEFAKVISFSFRLFGNIFAGEVLLTVMAFLVPYIAPLPFYGLEMFVAFVQALVFALLTLVFLKMGVTDHGGHDESPKPIPIVI